MIDERQQGDDVLLELPLEKRLDRIIELLAAQANKPEKEKPRGDVRFDLAKSALAATIVPTQYHTRARVKTVVLSMSAVDSVDLSIGAETWRFYDLGVGTNIIAFPETLDRGVDVMAKPVTGTTLLTAFLIVEDVE